MGKGFTTSKQTPANTYLRFVFFCEPRGVCVWRVGNCDIDVVWLHLHFRNETCPFSKQSMISLLPLFSCTSQCRAHATDTSLTLSEAGKTSRVILQVENQPSWGPKTPLHEDHLGRKAKSPPQQLLLQKAAGPEVQRFTSF